MKPRGGTLAGDRAAAVYAAWLRLDRWNVAEAAKRVKFQMSDLFGALDALGIRGDEVHGAQVTTGHSGLKSERRRKLEAVEWPRGWRIYLVNHERVPDPADRKRSLDYWRREEWALHGAARAWEPATATAFDLATVLDAMAAPRRAREAAELEALRKRVAAAPDPFLAGMDARHEEKKRA